MGVRGTATDQATMTGGFATQRGKSTVNEHKRGEEGMAQKAKCGWKDDIKYFLRVFFKTFKFIYFIIIVYGEKFIYK